MKDKRKDIVKNLDGKSVNTQRKHNRDLQTPEQPRKRYKQMVDHNGNIELVEITRSPRSRSSNFNKDKAADGQGWKTAPKVKPSNSVIAQTTHRARTPDGKYLNYAYTVTTRGQWSGEGSKSHSVQFHGIGEQDNEFDYDNAAMKSAYSQQL